MKNKMKASLFLALSIVLISTSFIIPNQAKSYESQEVCDFSLEVCRIELDPILGVKTIWGKKIIVRQ